MRINQYLARHTELSRRSADTAIQEGRVEINHVIAKPGDIVIESDTVTLDGVKITEIDEITTIIFHKPAGYVVSKNGQGNRTIYDILPEKFHNLNPVGRLDKDSSGLLLLTNHGNLANQLTHPKYQKEKTYLVELNKPLASEDKNKIAAGVHIGDERPSRLEFKVLDKHTVKDKANRYCVTLSEGRNRQIRRTFAALGYEVVGLHRVSFGSYELGSLPERSWQKIT